MHSRTSSRRPSSIFLGRKGSGMERGGREVLGREAGRGGVLAPLGNDPAELEVPEVDQVVGQLDEGEALLLRETVLASERVEDVAGGDGAAGAGGRLPAL